MDRSTVTRKQAAAAVTVALLSPLMRTLPRASVLLAGRAAWLALLPALPPLLLLAALTRRLRRALRPGEGMAGLLLRVLGPVPGRLLLVLWWLFFLGYAAFILRSGAERLAAAVYQESRPEPFLAVTLALCLLTALGPPRAAGRTAVVLRGLLLTVFAGAALLVLPNLSLSRLIPLYIDDLAGAVPGAWPFVTLGSAGALFLFLAGCLAPEEPRPVLPGSVAAVAVAGAILCLETLGTFGPALTTRLTYPFFTMVRDVSLFHLAQRIEAAVIALWVLADYLMGSLLLRCAHEAVRTPLHLPPPEGAPLLSPRRGRWLLWAEAGAVLVLACGIAPSAGTLLRWECGWIPLLLNCLTLGSLGLVFLVGRLRKLL